LITGIGGKRRQCPEFLYLIRNRFFVPQAEQAI
jgi:hypothetical protein